MSNTSPVSAEFSVARGVGHRSRPTGSTSLRPRRGIAILVASLALPLLLSPVFAQKGHVAPKSSAPAVVEPPPVAKKVEGKSDAEKQLKKEDLAQDPQSVGTSGAKDAPPSSDRSIERMIRAGETLTLAQAESASRTAWRVLDSQFDRWTADAAEKQKFGMFVSGPSRLSYDNDMGRLFDQFFPSGLQARLLQAAGERGLVSISEPLVKNRALVAFWPSGTKGANATPPNAIAVVEPGNLAAATVFTPTLARFTERGVNHMRYFSAPAANPADSRGAAVLAINSRMYYRENEGQTGLFDPVGFRDFPVDPKASLKIIDQKSDTTFELLDAEQRVLKFDRGDKTEFATMAKLLGCCVFVRPPALVSAFAKMLRSKVFSAERVRIAVMVRDTATKDVVMRDALLGKSGRVEFVPGEPFSGEKWLTEQMENARGQTLLLLGHVEGSNFVIRSPANEELGRVSMARANELAVRHSVTLFNLGCRTADHLSSMSGIGVANTFNSVHMVKTIAAALRAKPSTIAGFLEKLGTPEANIVLPAHLLADQSAWARLSEETLPNGAKALNGRTWRAPGTHVVVTPDISVLGKMVGLKVHLTLDRKASDGAYPVVATMYLVIDHECDKGGTVADSADVLLRRACSDQSALAVKHVTTTYYGTNTTLH